MEALPNQWPVTNSGSSLCASTKRQPPGSLQLFGSKEGTGLHGPPPVFGRARTARLHEAGAGDEQACNRDKEHKDEHARHAAALPPPRTPACVLPNQVELMNAVPAQQKAGACTQC